MSYCVNCGVELDSSAKKCALCATPVVNPNILKAEETDKPFSDAVQLPKGIKKRFLALAISVTMLVPNIVMLFLNIFFIQNGFWSIYVLASCILVWVLFVFPLLIKKRIRPYLLWAFDTLAISSFFFIVFALLGVPSYVFSCVESLVILLSASALFDIIWLRRKKRHWTAITVAVLLEIALTGLLAGIAVSLLSRIYDFFVVGIVIFCCSFVMMCFFIYCNRSKHVRAWLNKAFYV